MLRLAYCDRFQDRRSLELAGVGLVSRRRRGIQRERIVDLRLIVVWIALGQLFHSLRIGLYAGAMIDSLVVGVHDRKRVQLIELALRLGTDALSLRDRGSAFDEVLRGCRDVRIPQQT